MSPHGATISTQTYQERKLAKLARRVQAHRLIEVSLSNYNQELLSANAALLAQCEELKQANAAQNREVAALCNSRGWRLLTRLRDLKSRLLPPQSRRERLARRAWQCLRAGYRLFAQRGAAQPTTSFSAVSVTGTESVVASNSTPACNSETEQTLTRTDGASIPTERKFSVVFIVTTGAYDAAAMRYRALNVIAALTSVGVEAAAVPDEEALIRLPEILTYDILVLVRRQYTERIAAVLDAAQAAGVAVVYDIDDYVFDPWVLPYIEGYYRHMSGPDALAFIGRLRSCLEKCTYFTGSTPYLAKQAAALGKVSFCIRNGVNSEQLQLSDLVRERGPDSLCDGMIRLGYFSGSKTHQADFRLAYPALMRLMQEFETLRLVVVGVLDLEHFAGLAVYENRIEIRPYVDWRALPAEIGRVDVNLIPLELNPFTEGKSDLKYYEAGLLKIPSVASPTGVLSGSIKHGFNGLLAATPNEWYVALKQLIQDGELREELGENAYRNVVQTYDPAVTAQEAVAAYRAIVRAQRGRRGVPTEALSLVFVLPDPACDIERVAVILELAEELTRVGHAVTLFVPESARIHSAAELEQFLAEQFFEPLFSIQLGGVLPCCDVLLATDAGSAAVVQQFEHRAYRTGKLDLHDELRFDNVLLQLQAWVDGSVRVAA